MVEACNYNVEKSRAHRPKLFLKGISYSILQWGFLLLFFLPYWNQKITMIVLSDAVKIFSEGADFRAKCQSELEYKKI